MSETQAPNPVGRPPDYNEEIAEAICILLSEGHALIRICEQDGMPHRVTVYRWVLNYPEFRNKYTYARAMQADSHMDEIPYIADTETDVARARVRIEARRISAERMAPKKYGPRLDVNPDPETPMNVSQSTVTAKDRAKAMAALLARKKAEEGDG